MISCLLDTGPLVALLDRTEREHTRVSRFVSQLQGQRLLTTGAVITEAFHFVSDLPQGPEKLASFLEGSSIEIHESFHSAALTAAAGLMVKYSDTPTDFADATLVWLAEETGIDRILTFDRRGFSTYRFGRSRRFKLIFEAP